MENIHPNLNRSTSAPNFFGQNGAPKRARVLAPAAVEIGRPPLHPRPSAAMAVTAPAAEPAANLHAVGFGQFIDIERKNRIEVDFFGEQSASTTITP